MSRKSRQKRDLPIPPSAKLTSETAQKQAQQPKVEIDYKTKAKRNYTVTKYNDDELEKLANKIGLTKSKIVDILIAKLIEDNIENEFDLYNLKMR